METVARRTDRRPGAPAGSAFVVYRLRMPVARQVRPLQPRRCGGQPGYRSAIPSGGFPSGSTTPAVTCGVRRKVILGPLTASASRRPTDCPRSSGRETLSVLRRLAGMGRSRTPQTDRHQTGCGRNQSKASSGGMMADELGSVRHAADRRSYIGGRKRSAGGEASARPIFHRFPELEFSDPRGEPDMSLIIS